MISNYYHHIHNIKYILLVAFGIASLLVLQTQSVYQRPTVAHAADKGPHKIFLPLTQSPEPLVHHRGDMAWGNALLD